MKDQSKTKQGLIQDVVRRKLAEEELQQLNEELDQRVRERTRELGRRNCELGQMNKAFVGRELELKAKGKGDNEDA